MKVKTTNEIVKEEAYINSPYDDIDCNNEDKKWVAVEDVKNCLTKELDNLLESNVDSLEYQGALRLVRKVRGSL